VSADAIKTLFLVRNLVRRMNAAIIVRIPQVVETAAGVTSLSHITVTLIEVSGSYSKVKSMRNIHANRFFGVAVTASETDAPV
jgi:hypothetical protein